MPLPLKVRAIFAVTASLTKLGVLPGNAKVVRRPVAQRLAMGPSASMTGPRIEVPVQDQRIPTRDGAEITVRVYSPPGATAPLLYLHGGGFSLGGLTSCDHICRRLAVEAGVVVVSVEYRLAPEHQYPGPLHDSEDALDWLLQQGWDADRLLLAGDSAGGNLAAALALRLRDRGTPVAGQLLLYPAVDLTASGDGVTGYRGPGLSYEDCRLCAELYLGDADPTDPYASPLHAPDLSGLAPALVVTVEYDPLHDEGVLYARRLKEAGVPTALLDVPDHAHGSLSLPVLFSGVDEVYRRMTDFLRDPASVTAGSGT